MPANLEYSAVAIGLEKVSLYSNPKERPCQRMLKLLYSYSHFTCQQDYAQNPSSLASAVHEPRTSRCTRWILKRQQNQWSNCQHPLDDWKNKRVSEKKNIYFCFIDYAKAFNSVDHNKLWEIPQEMGLPDHLTCLLRSLYAGQEATVRTGHGTDWFQIGKGVR